MKNPGFYAWKDEEKINGDRPARASRAESAPLVPAAPVAVHSPAPAEQGSLELKFARNLRLLEKHERVSAIFLLLVVIDLFAVAAAWSASFSLLASVPCLIAGLATVYYFRRDQNLPLSLNELEHMRRLSLESAAFSEEDADLISKYIHKHRTLARCKTRA